jgi:hypothetical protein
MVAHQPPGVTEPSASSAHSRSAEIREAIGVRKSSQRGHGRAAPDEAVRALGQARRGMAATITHGGAVDGLSYRSGRRRTAGRSGASASVFGQHVVIEDFPRSSAGRTITRAKDVGSRSEASARDGSCLEPRLARDNEVLLAGHPTRISPPAGKDARPLVSVGMAMPLGKVTRSQRGVGALGSSAAPRAARRCVGRLRPAAQFPSVDFRPGVPATTSQGDHATRCSRQGRDDRARSRGERPERT